MVEFTVAAAAGPNVFARRVEFIDPVVQTATRTIVVKARAPNPSRLLRRACSSRPGSRRRCAPNAVVVPEDAIQPHAHRQRGVGRGGREGEPPGRELGVRSQGVVEILSGVRGGRGGGGGRTRAHGRRDAGRAAVARGANGHWQDEGRSDEGEEILIAYQKYLRTPVRVPRHICA